MSALALVPLLPDASPAGRTVALLGGAAVAAWLAAVVVLAVKRRGRDAAWAASLPAVAAVAGLLGPREPGWHVVLVGMIAGLALRNVTLTEGPARWLTAAGLLSWIAAIARARVLFG